jgi:hypothetical protein
MPGIDFDRLRREIPMEDVLHLIGFQLPSLGVVGRGSRIRLPRPRRGYPALIPRPDQEIFSTPPLFFLGALFRLEYCLFTKTGRQPSSW